MARFSLKRFVVEESAYDIVRGASWDLNVGSPRSKFIFFPYFIDFIFEMTRIALEWHQETDANDLAFILRD